jgi:hypothetical protein
MVLQHIETKLTLENWKKVMLTALPEYEFVEVDSLTTTYFVFDESGSYKSYKKQLDNIIMLSVDAYMGLAFSAEYLNYVVASEAKAIFYKVKKDKVTYSGF